MNTSRLLGAVCAVFVICSPDSGASVITPVGVSASSTFGGTYNPDNLINDSGLISGGLHSNNWYEMWLSDDGDVNATLIFDLGDVFSITSTDIWQYNADCCGLTRGVQAFDIYSSNDGSNFDFVTSGYLTQSPLGSVPAQNIEFNATAQFIRFNISSNFGDPGNSGLSEVKFNGVAVVPVPGGVWLICSGLLGLLGFARRNRAA